MLAHRHHRTDCLGLSAGIGRRKFVGLASLGTGLALLLGGVPSLAKAGNAKALMLSCMDYRLIDDAVRFMDSQGLQDNYDHVVLAGASLGVVSDKFAAWHDTFWQHLDLAIQLHHIEEVIALDHRDCGAYKLAVGEEAVATVDKETAAHAQVLADFSRRVKAKHGGLGVQAYLMALDGSVESIAV